MTATAEPPAATVEAPPPTEAPTHLPLDRGEGVELLGDIHGCGYRDGACLVRRRDGQMVQLGPLMYALLESIDGQRDGRALAEALSERLGRRVGEPHVLALAKKLAAQGLLAGFEGKAPPRRNPLLALKWKVLVTNEKLTRRLTAPFTFLFRPWIMWPILACFAGVFWFVLIHKGVGAATAEAFRKPGLFLIVFALAVVSAGLHELGHAAAARYGGATPGGMGMGLYLVWPAFYTDVTDAYRLPKRDRLRVDLAGLYFNAAVAVITMAAWLLLRIDALLLLVALQVLQMIKQLSPVIRADGYHILSDATGVPDLFAHLIPTMRRLLPGHRNEPSALSGRARLLVTVWVLIVVPVLLSLMIGAVVLLPHLATSAWNSGSHIASAIGRDASHGQILDLLAGVISLVALVLPVLGSVLITQKIVRTTVARAHGWSRGRPVRRTLVLVAGAAAIAGMIWAWWPSGQYRPIPARGGTLGGLVHLVSAPATMARPAPAVAPVSVAPGTHLALSMIPVGGATKKHPALFVIRGQKGKPPVVIYSTSTPAPPTTVGPVTQGSGTSSSSAPTSTTSSSPGSSSSSTTTPTSSPSPTSDATAFPFQLPAAPGPGGTQALAVNTTNGGVKYDVAYSLVTVKNGAPVTNTNSAFALAHCQACTTVAVSFQVVLVIGSTKDIAPINAAGALNYNCPACTTTAIADQIVITLNSQPSRALMAQLEQALSQLNALPALGANGTPAAVATEVSTVQQEVETELNQSGLVANPPKSSSTSSSSNPASGSGSSSSSATSTTTTSGSSSTSAPAASSPSSSSSTSSSSSGSSSGSTPATTTGSSTSTTTTSSSSPTTTSTATTTPTTSSP